MSIRTYPVPRSVEVPRPLPADGGMLSRALQAASAGRVRGYQLPILAACDRGDVADWAKGVQDSANSDGILSAAGYDPYAYYYGALDDTDDDSDTDVVRAVIRQDPDDGQFSNWEGSAWSSIDAPEGTFVILDEQTLADILSAISSGSAGLALRPTQPRAWMRTDSCPSTDPLLADASGDPNDEDPKQTGAMVAFYVPPELAKQLAVPDGEDPNDLHVTLAYLGDIADDDIDPDAVHRAVERWSADAPTSFDGEISGNGEFQTDDGPVQYASVDCPGLSDARSALVQHLEDEGVNVAKNHGFTPHITLQYGDQTPDVSRQPITFDRVSTSYGPTRKDYGLGSGAILADAGPAGDVLYAIVDEYDTNAVLDLIMVTAGPKAYIRKGGKWVEDPDTLNKLLGIDPPPVVEVPPNARQSVLDQVDSFDKQQGVTAAAWSGMACDPAQHAEIKDDAFDVAYANEGLAEHRRRAGVNAHLAAMHRRLSKSGLKPSQVDAVIRKRVADERQQRDEFDRARALKAATERVRRMKAAVNLSQQRSVTADASTMPNHLRDYWSTGKGALKIRWNTSGDFNRCRRALAKYLHPEQLAGACANLHKLATGHWPGPGRGT